MTTGEAGERQLYADPDSALRPGRADALIVLSLWLGRRLFLPLLLIGLIFGWITGQLRTEESIIATWDSADDLVRALLTPLAGIALAVLIRIGVGFAALAAAWPLSRWDRAQTAGTRGSFYRTAIDRWRLAQAYRSLRWTWGVREAAIRRAGTAGRRLGLAVPVTTVLSILLVIAYVVVVAVQPAS
jgi:hypothetical protein